MHLLGTGQLVFLLPGEKPQPLSLAQTFGSQPLGLSGFCASCSSPPYGEAIAKHTSVTATAVVPTVSGQSRFPRVLSFPISTSALGICRRWPWAVSGAALAAVSPALSEVLMSVCFLSASLPSSLPYCSKLQKELGTLRAFQASSVFECQQRVFTGLKYIVGPWLSANPQAKRQSVCLFPTKVPVGCARQLRDTRCNSSFSPPCPEFNTNGQQSAGSSVWSLSSCLLPVPGPVRGEKLIRCTLNTHQGTLTAPACKDSSTS